LAQRGKGSCLETGHWGPRAGGQTGRAWQVVASACWTDGHGFSLTSRTNVAASRRRGNGIFDMEIDLGSGVAFTRSGGTGAINSRILTWALVRVNATTLRLGHAEKNGWRPPDVSESSGWMAPAVWYDGPAVWLRRGYTESSRAGNQELESVNKRHWTCACLMKNGIAVSRLA
jgi:hypothetical protein